METNRQSWSFEEDTLLYELVRTEGQKWRKFSKHPVFYNRTDDSLRNRYNRITTQPNKSIKSVKTTKTLGQSKLRVMWSEEEDEMLKRFVEMKGQKWQELIVLGRTVHAIRNRWSRLQQSKHLEINVTCENEDIFRDALN